MRLRARGLSGRRAGAVGEAGIEGKAIFQRVPFPSLAVQFSGAFGCVVRRRKFGDLRVPTRAAFPMCFCLLDIVCYAVIPDTCSCSLFCPWRQESGWGRFLFLVVSLVMTHDGEYARVALPRVYAHVSE